MGSLAALTRRPAAPAVLRWRNIGAVVFLGIMLMFLGLSSLRADPLSSRRGSHFQGMHSFGHAPGARTHLRGFDMRTDLIPRQHGFGHSRTRFGERQHHGRGFKPDRHGPPRFGHRLSGPRKCRKVYKRGRDSFGRRALIGSVMCYDPWGQPYIVKGSRFIAKHRR
jgi:hypothetical protein